MMSEADKLKAGGEVRPTSWGRPRHDSEYRNDPKWQTVGSCGADILVPLHGGQSLGARADMVRGGGEDRPTR